MTADGLALEGDAPLSLALDGGGRLATYATAGGSFLFTNVPEGMHLLAVESLHLVFPTVRPVS